MKKDIYSLPEALDRLFALRDQWGFYTIPLPNAERKPYDELQRLLEYMAKLWLMDAYYNTYDYVKRNSAAGTKSKKSAFKQTKRADISVEIIKYVGKIENSISLIADSAPALLCLQLDDLQNSLVTARNYLAKSEESFALLQHEELKQLLNKFLCMAVEEELPVLPAIAA